VTFGRHSADRACVPQLGEDHEKSEPYQGFGQQSTGLEVRIFGRNKLVERSNLQSELPADTTDQKVPGKGHFPENDDGALLGLLIGLGYGGESDVTLLHSRDWAP
jgi:hypothetical protein